MSVFLWSEKLHEDCRRINCFPEKSRKSHRRLIVSKRLQTRALFLGGLRELSEVGRVTPSRLRHIISHQSGLESTRICKQTCAQTAGRQECRHTPPTHTVHTTVSSKLRLYLFPLSSREEKDRGTTSLGGKQWRLRCIPAAMVQLARPNAKSRTMSWLWPMPQLYEQHSHTSLQFRAA
jgi:hypothetical protein